MRKGNVIALGILLVSCVDGEVGEVGKDPEITPPSGGGKASNVLLIGVDDLKPLLKCYGDPIAITPNIDKLASRSKVFLTAYCQQAVSAPSRASLLTGLSPDQTKVWDLNTLIRSKNPEVVTLPQIFKENGYTTYGIGKIFDPRSVDKDLDAPSWSIAYDDSEKYHNTDYPKPQYGYYQDSKTVKEMQTLEAKYKEQGLTSSQARAKVLEELKPSSECVEISDDAYSDGAIASGLIAQLKKSKPSRNFWAVGFKKPHLPFIAPKKYWDLYSPSQIALASHRGPVEGAPSWAHHNSSETMTYTDVKSASSFSESTNLVMDESKQRELIHAYYACVSYIDAQIGRVLDALEENGYIGNTTIVLFGDHGWHLGDHGMWNKHSNFEQAVRVPMLISDPSMSTGQITTPAEFTDIYPTLCELHGIEKPTELSGVSQVGDNTREYAVSQYPRSRKMGYSLRSARFRYTVWVRWDNEITDFDNVYATELYDYVTDPTESRNLVNDPSYAEDLRKMEEYWKEYKSIAKKR